VNTIKCFRKIDEEKAFFKIFGFDTFDYSLEFDR